MSNEAIIALEELIKIDTNINNFSLLAMNYHRIKNDEECIKYLNAALSLSNSSDTKLSIDDLLLLCKCFLECECIDDCKRIIKILRNENCKLADVDNLEGLTELLIASNKLKQTYKENKNISYLECKELFNRSYTLFNLAIRKDKKFVDAYLNRAEIYCKLKSPFDAVTDYKIVIELDDECIRAYNNVGGCLIRQGECATSLEYLNKVLYNLLLGNKFITIILHVIL